MQHLNSDRNKALTVAVLARSVATEADVLVTEAFIENGHQTVIIEPDATTQMTINPDLYVMTGPYFSLAPAIHYLEVHGDKRPLIYWFTESIPPPAWPKPLVTLLSDLRYRLEKPLYQSKSMRLGSKLPDMGRLRSCGEMRYLHKSGRLYLLVTSTEYRARYFRSMGLPAACLSMGYAPVFGSDLDLPRDIDVIFIGSTRDRRRGKIIPELKRKLDAIGIQMVIKDGSQQYGFAYGFERTKLLNRSKIALNIMRAPWDTLVYRTLVSAANKAMVLSEPVLDAGPFSSGTHFVESEISTMAETIQYYLANTTERERIATTAHKYVTEDLTMQRMVNQLVKILQERNAG